MENILYQVNRNFLPLDVQEVKYTKKTDSYYWIGDNRYSLVTNYYKMFDNKYDAVKHLRFLVRMEISLAESALEYNKERMRKIDEKFVNI